MNTVMINTTALTVKEYKGQRVVTFKEIDAVHGRPDGTARKRFNDNRNHFIEKVDYFKVCVSEIRTHKIMELSPKAHEDVVFLTESGYLMLVKSFTDDLAWNVQRELVNSYFCVRSNPAKALTPGAEKRAQAMALNAKTRVAKQLMTLWDKAGVSPAHQALALGDYYAEDGIKLPAIALQESTKVTYDKTTIADKLGILSKSGKPHAQAVGAIIAQLDIGESEREAVPYSRNGHDGVDYQYTESVIDKVDSWLTQHGQPAQIISGGKSYSVKYV